MNLETISPAFRLIDKSFDRNLSSASHLSFILSLSGFAYCILDLKQNRLTALEEITFRKQPNYEALCSQLKSFLSQTPTCNAGFKSISAGIYNETATLIPSALFDENKKREFLQFNFSAESRLTGMAESDFLQEMELFNVYDAPAIIAKTFKEIYGKAKVSHFSSSLIESLFIDNKFKAGLKIYLHFFQKKPYGSVSRFEMIILKDGKLLLFNSFYFQEKEDIAYYLLFALEQLNINPGNTAVTMLGNIQKTDEAVDLMSSYVRSVEFGSRPGNFEASPVFDELPSHFYYALLSQYLYS